MSASSEKRRRVIDNLGVVRGCTKTGIAELLSRLHKEGALGYGIADCSSSALKKRLHKPIDDLRSIQTPHGPLFRRIHIGAPRLPTIEVVNPMAHLHHLAQVCDGFAKLLLDASDGGNREMRIVMYMDTISPGNPLRPDKSRTTECLYWSIIDFPDHVLKRQLGWLVYSTVRTTILERLPGRNTAWMKLALREFFAPAAGRPSFRSGIVVSSRDRAFMVRCKFAGFIADEKALKEFMGLKGASGSKPCITCRNLVQFVEPEVLEGSRFVGPDEIDHRLLEYQTSDDVYDIVDRLSEVASTESKAALHRAEQALGVSFEPDGVLFAADLRDVCRPIEHYIRDTMHILVSGGVAGTETARVIEAIVSTLGEGGLPANACYAHLQAYIDQFVMPKASAKRKGWCVAEKMVGVDHMRCFASDLLDLAPLLLAFLEDVMAPRDLLVEHTRCYKLLVRILHICTMGPRQAASHLVEFRQSILDHHAMYRVLYPTFIKPKWHQLLHVPENIQSLGMSLSCFTQERKHRCVKAVGLWAFRNYETTVLADVVRYDIERICDGSLFLRESLIAPVRHLGFDTSNTAALACGEVRKGDLVACRGRRILDVHRFWQHDDSIFVQGAQLVATDGPVLWSHEQAPSIVFLQSLDVIDIAAWAHEGERLRVVLPPAGLGFEH